MTDADLTAAFWKHLRSDRIVMLGLETRAALRPMTAQIDPQADAQDARDHGPIWFFSASTSDLVKSVTAQDLALMSFVSKDQAIYATVHGHLTRSMDRAVIDRLWSPKVAGWYAGGKADPALALLRFDPVRAEIWHDATGFMAGLSLLFGTDPKARPPGSAVKISLN